MARTHRLVAVADANGAVGEYDEMNNGAIHSITVVADGGGDFFISLSSPEVTRGEPFEIAVTLDFDHNAQNPAPAGIEGWSYGIGHDADFLRILDARAGEDTLALRDGSGPAFIALTPCEGGITVAVTVDEPPGHSTAPAGNGWQDAIIRYEAHGQAMDCAAHPGGAMTSVTVSDALGDPAVPIVAYAGGAPVPFSGSEGGAVTIACGTLFLRGDANATGTVDIGDMVFQLNYQFASGPAPPPPAAACGADPTPDPIPCDAHAPCS
ncbi:MAG: hypothetical protein JXP34_01060 [Planctomycetes bacterium]|nr:hypothetical protein [Planctomycetota bacterium]